MADVEQPRPEMATRSAGGAAVPRASLDEAVAAFLSDGAPAPGYRHGVVGAYQALWRDDMVVLLAATDGAAYVCSDAGQGSAAGGCDVTDEVRAALGRRGYRESDAKLLVRIPTAGAGGAGAGQDGSPTARGGAGAGTSGAGRVGTFTLWASARYRAALLAGDTPGQAVWK